MANAMAVKVKGTNRKGQEVTYDFTKRTGQPKTFWRGNKPHQLTEDGRMVRSATNLNFYVMKDAKVVGTKEIDAG